MAGSYGLIFDVDGVIADTERVNAEASIQVLADLFGMRGVQRKDFEAGLGRGAEEYVKAAARVHGLDLTAEDVVAATNARQENFLRLLREKPLAPFPGVLELMSSALAHNEFRVAIATSSTREKSEAVLQSTGIPYERMVYITGSDVTHKKPHPELFAAAAGRLGIPASSCVVIEDAPNGVEAARAAGCKSIAVADSTSAEKLSLADRVVPTLTEIAIADVLALISS